jgi:hypothetical protein
LFGGSAAYGSIGALGRRLIEKYCIGKSWVSLREGVGVKTACIEQAHDPLDVFRLDPVDEPLFKGSCELLEGKIQERYGLATVRITCAAPAYLKRFGDPKLGLRR